MWGGCHFERSAAESRSLSGCFPPVIPAPSPVVLVKIAPHRSCPLPRRSCGGRNLAPPAVMLSGAGGGAETSLGERRRTQDARQRESPRLPIFILLRGLTRPRRSCGGRTPPPPRHPRRQSLHPSQMADSTRSTRNANANTAVGPASERRPTTPHSTIPAAVPTPATASILPRTLSSNTRLYSHRVLPERTFIRGRGRLGSKAATGQRARVTCRATSRLGTLCAVAGRRTRGRISQ